MYLFSKDKSNYILWFIDLLITQGYVDKNILILTNPHNSCGLGLLTWRLKVTVHDSPAVLPTMFSTVRRYLAHWLWPLYSARSAAVKLSWSLMPRSTPLTTRIWQHWGVREGWHWGQIQLIRPIRQQQQINTISTFSKCEQNVSWTPLCCCVSIIVWVLSLFHHFIRLGFCAFFFLFNTKILLAKQVL